MLTVLATDSVPGLQIYHAGTWRDVPPRPGCFVVNVGGAPLLGTIGWASRPPVLEFS